MMEQNYYEECIQKIKQLIEQGEYKEAEHLLMEELSMPYIPSFAEKQFVELERQLHGLMSKQGFNGVLPSEIEASLLSEDPQVQLMAVQSLAQYSCRSYLDVIQAFFDLRPDPKIQALMIDILIEQQINEEFEIEVDGMNMTFIPLYQERPHETDGYAAAWSLINEWFENENPALCAMCQQILIQECFLMLPMAYDELEALSLALSIVEHVSLSLDDGASYRKIASQQGDNVKRCVLKSCFV